MAPRLFDVPAAGLYLNISPWAVRDLIAGGIVPRVRVPLSGHREMRKVLVDKTDLDRLIAAWKERPRV